MSKQLREVNAESWALMISLLCGALLVAALIMEHLFAMEPCPMCMMQRLWVFAVGLIAYIGLLHNPRWGIYPLLGMGAAADGRQLLHPTAVAAGPAGG